MKTIIILLSFFVLSAVFTGCKKDKKNDPAVNNPPPPTNENEIITTVKLYITDSITNTTVVKGFSDPDGDGAQPGSFSNNGTDSSFVLMPDRTYFCKLYFLDETKSPVDTLSKAIGGDEGYVHMIFYNGDPSATGNYGNVILAQSPNYAVQLNGSNIKISYLDLDNGPAKGYAQRNIGLYTKFRTASSPGTALYPLRIALRHQPGTEANSSAKDGTYAPGSTDVEITFKVGVY